MSVIRRRGAWSGQPNGLLVQEVEGFAVRLDVGAGEGADAVWLASRGWQVTAVDISRRLLVRGRLVRRGRGRDVARE